MKQVVLSFPDGIAQALKLSDREFVQELRFLAAAKLFELGRLSSGKAAELAGRDRVSFLYDLHRVGISAINLQEDEVDAEIAAAHELAR